MRRQGSGDADIDLASEMVCVNDPKLTGTLWVRQTELSSSAPIDSQQGKLLSLNGRDFRERSTWITLKHFGRTGRLHPGRSSNCVAGECLRWRRVSPDL